MGRRWAGEEGSVRRGRLKVGRRRAGEEGIGERGEIESTGLAECTSKRCGHARWVPRWKNEG